MGPLDLTIRAFGLQRLVFHFVALKLTGTALQGQKNCAQVPLTCALPGFPSVWTQNSFFVNFWDMELLGELSEIASDKLVRQNNCHITTHDYYHPNRFS